MTNKKLSINLLYMTKLDKYSRNFLIFALKNAVETRTFFKQNKI